MKKLNAMMLLSLIFSNVSYAGYPCTSEQCNTNCQAGCPKDPVPIIIGGEEATHLKVTGAPDICHWLSPDGKDVYGPCGDAPDDSDACYFQGQDGKYISCNDWPAK